MALAASAIDRLVRILAFMGRQVSFMYLAPDLYRICNMYVLPVDVHVAMIRSYDISRPSPSLPLRILMG